MIITLIIKVKNIIRRTMKYSKMLRELFSGISLQVEDLFLLESFQIKYLQDRVPTKEFSAMLRAYPYLQRFLILKCPLIEDFIHTVLNENPEIANKDEIDAYCNELLWEIADLIVYNKYPEIYDDKVSFNWEIEEIIPKDTLKRKAVADVGAGSGMLAFLLAQYAKTVYAIEPIPGFREFIRAKAIKEKFSNIYTIEGFLDIIPLPDNSLDVLFTSNAIGWNIDKELQEIERVVKPGGQAIHIMRVNENVFENPVHKKLVSPDWKYDFFEYKDNRGLKRKWKKFI